jgi:hypothetical protein
MKRSLTILFLVFRAALLHAQVTHIDAHGDSLRQYYLGLDVERLWLKGHHIDWKTGGADDPYAGHNIKTHCSVFVAAACMRKGIYILRPPDHKQALLANAQYDWLQSPMGRQYGWRPLSSDAAVAVYLKAQEYANKGYVVVAVYQNPDPHKPGHIALVMPEEMSEQQLAQDGPELIMAGHVNSSHISLRKGFEKHISQWPEHVISFYYFDRGGYQ